MFSVYQDSKRPFYESKDRQLMRKIMALKLKEVGMRFESLKLIVIALSALVVMAQTGALYGASAVTYELCHGRMGDKLLSVSHAKWISYKYNIPFVYRPFDYSDQFTMHLDEQLYSATDFAKYRKVVLDDQNIVINPKANILYIVPYFPESDFESDRSSSCFYRPRYFSVDWTDRSFLNELRDFIKPRFQLTSPAIPQGYISVAVHVRKGGGFDVANLTQLVPHKSPPDCYFIEQIKRLTAMFPNQMLYVFLFTDHDKPLELMNSYESAVNNERVRFACREIDNAHNKNVLDDFFALTKFDCLIRSDSNFSLVASKLADYRVQISPYHITEVITDRSRIAAECEQRTEITDDQSQVKSNNEQKKEIIIDQVRVEINNEQGNVIEICDSLKN